MVFILAKYNQHLHYTVTANTEAIEKMDVWRNKSFRPNNTVTPVKHDGGSIIFTVFFCCCLFFGGGFATVTWVNCTKCTA